MLTRASGASPLVLPDDVLDQLGERYLALPAVWRARMTFERFLLDRMQIRNGTMFLKLRCPRVHRRNAGRNFQQRGEA